MDLTPEQFSVVAVGVGALIVGVATVASAWLTHISNRKNREQAAVIADDQADAIRLQAMETAKISQRTQDIKVSIDGRMDELLETTRQLAERVGMQTARDEIKGEVAAAVLATTARDDKVVTKVSEAVVERIGVAADKAANTVPAQK